MRAENILVEFIVEYDDGRTARMAIDCYTFGVGNHVAVSRLGHHQEREEVA